MSFNHELTQFIQQNFVAPHSPIQITDDVELIERGLIDSQGLAELVLFVEERTGVRIPDEEVMPDNFQTVTDISALVARLRTAQGA